MFSEQEIYEMLLLAGPLLAQPAEAVPAPRRPGRDEDPPGAEGQHIIRQEPTLQRNRHVRRLTQEVRAVIDDAHPRRQPRQRRFMDQAPAEPRAVTRAKDYVEAHLDEPITLEEMGRHIGVSRFHFCKLFKKSTGMTFTDYLARVRVEKVKNLLLNPHKRISEAAFEAGFQSLSQFNRVFRRVAGESPTSYRDRIHPSPKG